MSIDLQLQAARALLDKLRIGIERHFGIPLGDRLPHPHGVVEGIDLVFLRSMYLYRLFRTVSRFIRRLNQNGIDAFPLHRKRVIRQGDGFLSKRNGKDGRHFVHVVQYENVFYRNGKARI